MLHLILNSRHANGDCSVGVEEALTRTLIVIHQNGSTWPYDPTASFRRWLFSQLHAIIGPRHGFEEAEEFRLNAVGHFTSLWKHSDFCIR